MAAANRVHAADITMLAIGVGTNVNNIEMEAIASDPVCLNLFSLDFSDLDSLFYAIESRACEGNIQSVHIMQKLCDPHISYLIHDGAVLFSH